MGRSDGLNMLRQNGGHVATQETAGVVHALTEIGLKIKVLSMYCYSFICKGATADGAVPLWQIFRVRK